MKQGIWLLIGLWSRRGRFALGAVGFVLAVAPIVGAQVLIERFTRQHASAETAEIAEDYLASGARAIGSGMNAVDSLVLNGVTACDERSLTLMRAATTSVLAVKATAVIDGDGSVRCNQFGTADAIEALSPPQALADDSMSLRLVRLQSTGRTMVMVLHALPYGGVGAFVPSDAITADLLPRALRATAVGTLTLANGATIAGFQPPDMSPQRAPVADLISADASSPHFPLATHLAVPYQTFAAQNSDLLAYARLGGGLAASMIFALLVYLLRGPPMEIARLREAQAHGEFVPYYQPVIDIASGRLVGCEVLIRWVKPNGTVVEPDSFILLAESSGLAVPMTRSLMRVVRADLDHAFGARPRLKISINLFNDHFARLKTVREIAAIFRGSRVSFNQLVFELTERQPLRNIQRARVIIRGLQDLGARVALDDAGAGHGGLAYLHQLGVDVVKIDRLFVETIEAGCTAAPIVDSLIKLGHDLGMEVVAEGVETLDQLDYLRRHGADSAQGFLFSPALPARMFLDLVETMEPEGREQPTRPGTLTAPKLGEQTVAVPAA